MKTYILSIALFVPVLLFGQLDRSKRPEPGAAPIINIPNSEVFKLDNGVTVILSENHKLPKVTFSLSLDVQPMLEKDMTGLSEVAGSLMMSGTSNRTKDVLDGEIDYIGATLNAGSSSIRLSCLTKHMDKGLTLMSDVIMNANFPQEEVDRIIKMNESNLLSTKSDANGMLRNASAVSNYPGHPYGEVMTDATLANINREAIVNYYNKAYIPKGSYLVVVGDISKEKTLEMANKYFGDWKTEAPKHEFKSNLPRTQGNRVIFVKKPGAVQSVVSITYRMDMDPSNPDYLKLKVLNGVLGGGAFGNRLMQNLREDKAYTYGCRSSVDVGEYGSTMSAGGNFRNDVTDSAITQILYELERITSDVVNDDEINLTKSSMAGGFARSLENPSTIAQFALSIIKNNLDQDYYQTYLKKLDAITKEDLLDVAKKYFTAKNCNIIVVGNEDIVAKLMPFDSDGKIEKLDAFGNEMKETLPADISKEELLFKYVSTITKTSSSKELAKKMKKIKSMEEVMELSMAQVPFPMSSTRFWISPNTEGQKMEGQGMVFQKSYFDGEKGVSISMQSGKKEMSAQEVSAKRKSVGLFPEMNYASSGMEFNLLGIEVKNDVECYVLELKDGESTTYDYFDRSTFYKIATTKIQLVDGESNETNLTYGDFKETEGFMFPMTLNISMGSANFSGKVQTIVLNGKIDVSGYQ